MTDQQPSYDDLALIAARLLRELDAATRRLDALRWQVENEGCAASFLGETTYECKADAPCGLCRLRSERDALRKTMSRILVSVNRPDDDFACVACVGADGVLRPGEDRPCAWHVALALTKDKAGRGGHSEMP